MHQRNAWHIMEMSHKCSDFPSYSTPPWNSTLSTTEAAIMCPLNLLYSQDKHLVLFFSIVPQITVCVPPQYVCIVLSLTIFLFISIVLCWTKVNTPGEVTSAEGGGLYTFLNMLSHLRPNSPWFTQCAIDLYSVAESLTCFTIHWSGTCHSISREDTSFIRIPWKVLPNAFWRSSCALTMAHLAHSRHSASNFWVNEFVLHELHWL